ncbi:MAG TPA: T9SS type A sorting domain-containing protein [Flavitalea sp.]|nr:T9SS type A sorting domain-containing protein [Flavitalea sp.]
MKHLVLFTLMIVSANFLRAQVTYTTATSGDFDQTTTWVGGLSGTPATSGNCNCKIVIKAGHTLKMNQNVTISNINFVLDGVNSVLTFNNNIDIVLAGTNSSIDVQNTQARIVKGNNNNNITLGGQIIYDGQATMINSLVAGTVNGLTSASALRASPQFQNGSLPVKLSDFKLISKVSGVTLSWTTSLEVNSSHFEIERSSDGKSWNTKGSINASGNVSVDKNYSFTDASPEIGTNYYRLKIVDIDARYEYSPVKAITFSAASLNVAVGPNPATSFLNININAPGNDPYRLRLINRSGQVVFDQKYSASHRMQVSVSNYAEGSYFLEVTSSAGIRQINKVMIVRN